MDVKSTYPVIDSLQSSDWNGELFQSLASSGMDAVHVTLAYWEDCNQTLEIIGQWNRWFREYSNLILPVYSVDDIARANRTSRTGIILGFQNSSPIEQNLDYVEIFHQLGIRIMQLTYNNQTLLGSGCFEEGDGGLTLFGKNVIREMNRVGMIVDLSHTNEQTSLDAIECSNHPVAITHANPLSYHNVPRNKSSRLLAALGESGGMLGFSLYPLHLENESDCTLESFCKMVAQTAELMGVQNIGIGSDLCLNWNDDQLEYMRAGTWDFQLVDKPSWPPYPTWFNKFEDIQNIADGLGRYSFNKEEVRMILGGNWLRFFTSGFQSH